MILELKDLPLAKERTAYFAMCAATTQSEALDLVEDLARHPHAEIRAAADFLKNRHESLLASLRAWESRQLKLTTAADVSFRSVVLDPGKRPNERPKGFDLVGCLPLEPDVDVIFGRSVYLMKQKGVLRRVWDSGELNAFVHSYCHDGRHVWFSVARLQKVPRLLVLDPHSEQIWEIGASDGLPLADPESLPDRNTSQVITVAPLSSGRVCLAGSFGRSWLAIATFDPKGTKTVKVFHEAREAPEANAKDQWARTTIAFEPAGMFTLAGDKGAQRVLIGRRCRDHQVAQHPLLVDPHTLTVEVMKDEVSPQKLQRGQVRNGAVYYVGHGRGETDLQLVNVAFPGHLTRGVMTGLPLERGLLVDDKEIHLLRYDTGRWELWHGTLARKQAQPVGLLPKGDFRYIGRSSHYGVLICMYDPQSSWSNIYQVVVAPYKIREAKVEPTPSKLVATVGPEFSPESAAKNRAAAERAIRAGARVGTRFVRDGQSKSLSASRVEDLPTEPFALENVYFPLNGENPKDLSYLSGLSPLKSIYLDCGTTDATLSTLTDLPNLTNLSLSGKGITDAALAHIRRFAKLTDLSLHRTSITDRGLAELKHLPALGFLGLGESDTTDAGVAELTSLTKLSGIALVGTRVTDKSAEHLARIQTLQSVNVSRTQITGAGLALLVKLPKLASLAVSAPKISEVDLATLANAPELRWLALEDMPIGETGLGHLSRLGSLSFIVLNRTGVTPEQAKKLQQALPKCKILGVTGYTSP
jgi:hypothetical protein